MLQLSIIKYNIAVNIYNDTFIVCKFQYYFMRQMRILIVEWRAVCEPLTRFQSIVNPGSRSWDVNTATTEI